MVLLYRVSTVDSEGFTNAYYRLHPLIRAILQLFLINPLGFMLIGTSDPIAQDAFKAMRIYPGSPIRWPGITLGGQSIEAAYIFRPAAVAA